MPFANLNDISLYYEEYGSGPTVLLLPELGGSTRSWSHVVDALAETHHLILLDIRGTGWSEKPTGEYHMNQIVDDVCRFMKGRPSPYHLVGCAMGSIVALEIALQQPTTVRSLVLCSVSPDIPERTKLYAGQRARDVRERGMRAVSRSSSVNSFPDGIARPVEAARREYEANFLANAPHAYAALSEALIAWQGGQRISAIQCPCLCLAGDQDFMWDPATVRATANVLPHAEFDCIRQAGHFPPISAPEAFVQRIVPFLTQHQDI